MCVIISMSDWKSTALLLGAGVGAYLYLIKPQLDAFGKTFDDTINFIPNAANNFSKAIDFKNFTNPLEEQRQRLNILNPGYGEQYQGAVVKLVNEGLNDTKTPLMPGAEIPLLEKIKQDKFVDDSLIKYSTIGPPTQAQKNALINANNAGIVSKTTNDLMTGQSTIPGTLIPNQSSTIKLGNYDTRIPTISNKSTGSSSSKSLNTSSAPVSTPKPSTPPPPTPTKSTGGTFAPEHYDVSAAHIAKVRENAAKLLASRG